MAVNRVPFTITTTAGGIDQNTRLLSGILVGVAVIRPTGASGLAAGVDITITDDDTGQTLLVLTNAANGVYIPRVAVVDNAGAAISGQYAAPVITRRVKVSVAQGGNAKTGTVVLMVDS